jgi:hypothetical protein
MLNTGETLMCKKKLLSAAIGTALAMGAGVSYAGTFDLTSPSSVTTYASEDIGISGTQIIATEFQVTYTIAPTSIDTTLYVNYTLNGGTWQTGLTSDNLTIGTGPAVSIVKDGAVGQNTVQFLIEAGSASLMQTAHPLVFSFRAADVYDLSSPGGEISVTVALTSAASGNTADTSESLVVAQSGSAVEISVAKDITNSRAAIDVAQGSTVFIDAIDDTTVNLGTIQLNNASGTIVSPKTGGTYSFNATAGKLTVLNGMFAASLTNNSVFIDIGGTTNVYDAGTDIAATTVDETTATWTLTPTELTTLYDYGTANSIIIKADGTTVINDNTDAPSATILVEFETDRIVSGVLKHVERNGTTCTMYNVPAEGAVDGVNIRVTNNSPTKTGIILGTLWDVGGNALFTNQTLVAELAPLNTTRITAPMLAEALSTATGVADSTWGGRAVLVLSSDLTDMEAFNLLRNAAGGPLLNMSTGGTGNSCD